MITRDELAKIKTAIDATGEWVKLKPIFEHLNGEVGYEKLRLGLVYWEKMGKQ
ncbi:MAG: hypothetical protein ACRCYT_00610 [Cetobacterium sp.]